MFSETIVESKRQGRNLVAVLNGMSIAAATKEGMLENETTTTSNKATSNKSSMFLSQNAEDDEADEADDQPEQSAVSQSSTFLNPLAGTFTPGALKSFTTEEPAKQPGWMTGFGQARPSNSGFPGAATKNIFAGQNGAAGSAGAPTLSASESLGTAQNNSSPFTKQPNADITSSQQVKEVTDPKPVSQSPFSNQNNPFAASLFTGSSEIFQPTQPPTETTKPSLPQTQPSDNSFKTNNTFSWSPSPQITGTSQPSQPSELPQPPAKQQTSGCKS